MKKYYFFLFIIIYTINGKLFSQKLTHTIDFETGNFYQGNPDACGDKNTGCDCAIGTSLQIITSNPTPRAGSYASRSRVIDCHERAEMKINGTLTGNMDWWIGWSIFIPDNYVKREGGIISQFHDILGGGGANNNPCPDYTTGGPSLFQFDTSGILEFAMRHQRTDCNGCLARTVFDSLQDIEEMRDKWTDFVVNANFSCNPANGFFKLWIRQYDEDWPVVPIIDYTGTTFPDKDSETAGPNFRTGLYFGNPDKVGGNTMIIYMDEMKAGKVSDGVEFGDVEPGSITEIKLFSFKQENSKIYPVPCSECYFDLDESWLGANIEITDILGKVALRTTYSQIDQKLELRDKFNGFVIVKIEKNDHLMIKKVMVE